MAKRAEQTVQEADQNKDADDDDSDEIGSRFKL